MNLREEMASYNIAHIGKSLENAFISGFNNGHELGLCNDDLDKIIAVRYAKFLDENYSIGERDAT